MTLFLTISLQNFLFFGGRPFRIQANFSAHGPDEFLIETSSSPHHTLLLFWPQMYLPARHTPARRQLAGGEASEILAVAEIPARPAERVSGGEQLSPGQ